MWLNPGQRTIALVGGAAVSLYVASRAAADAATAGRPTRSAAGRLALGHWLPVAAVAVVAAAQGQAVIAVGIVFATSVACLSLGLGTLAVVTPTPVAAPASARRTWPLLVPVALIGWAGGFQRDVGRLTVVGTLLVGACVLLVWTEPTAPAVIPPPEPSDDPPRRGWSSALMRVPVLVLAIGLAVVGAGLAVAGLTSAARANEAARPGLLAASVLAPLVVLPILGSVAEWSARGPAAAGDAASSLVGMALLGGCAGLPLVWATAAGRSWLVHRLAIDPELLWHWHGWPPWLGVPMASSPTLAAAAATQPAAVPVDSVPVAVPFPMAVWRVDAVALVALAMLTVPIAAGRYALTRAQGAGLIVGYAVYLFFALKLGLPDV